MNLEFKILSLNNPYIQKLLLISHLTHRSLSVQIVSVFKNNGKVAKSYCFSLKLEHVINLIFINPTWFNFDLLVQCTQFIKITVFIPKDCIVKFIELKNQRICKKTQCHVISLSVPFTLGWFGKGMNNFQPLCSLVYL